jgi:hypothetical protein
MLLDWSFDIVMMYFLNMIGIERIIINGGPFKFKLQIDDYEDTKNKDNCNKAISN